MKGLHRFKLKFGETFKLHEDESADNGKQRSKRFFLSFGICKNTILCIPLASLITSGRFFALSTACFFYYWPEC
ncbi:MAG: hypothetical protein DRI57_14035 [Deltaproteobacteria bacterium]|nr:MAG: hypothetical protein DRI57_14035 [Deltaproteobacteria bacterium]